MKTSTLLISLLASTAISVPTRQHPHQGSHHSHHHGRNMQQDLMESVAVSGATQAQDQAAPQSPHPQRVPHQSSTMPAPPGMPGHGRQEQPNMSVVPATSGMPGHGRQEQPDTPVVPATPADQKPDNVASASPNAAQAAESTAQNVESSTPNGATADSTTKSSEQSTTPGSSSLGNSGSATYHEYKSNDSLTTVACSDGANGIMTRFGYTDISALYPYVTAYSGAGWNSDQCGRCIAASNGSNTVYLTVIDSRSAQHTLDIAPPAFKELLGDDGVAAGQGSFQWDFVAASNCQGNLG